MIEKEGWHQEMERVLDECENVLAGVATRMHRMRYKRSDNYWVPEGDPMERERKQLTEEEMLRRDADTLKASIAERLVPMLLSGLKDLEEIKKRLGEDPQFQDIMTEAEELARKIQQKLRK